MSQTELSREIESKRKAKGLTRAQLGAEVGVSGAAVQQWENGTTAPKRKTMPALARALGITFDSALLQTVSAEYAVINQLDVVASAGGGAVQSEVQILRRIETPKTWIEARLGVPASCVSIITVRGNSMSGTVEDGGVVFVDHTVREYDTEGVYVFAAGGEIRIKRLQKMTNGTLAIISDNKQYLAEYLNPEQADCITICGKVLLGINFHDIT